MTTSHRVYSTTLIVRPYRSLIWRVILQLHTTSYVFSRVDAPISFKAIGHKRCAHSLPRPSCEPNILAPFVRKPHTSFHSTVSFLSDKNIAWEATGGQFRGAYDIIRLPDYLTQGDRGEALPSAKGLSRLAGLSSIPIARRTSDEFFAETSRLRKNRRRRSARYQGRDVAQARRLLDVVHREQVLEEARLDPRSVGAVLAGEVRLEGDHAAAHL